MIFDFDKAKLVQHQVCSVAGFEQIVAKFKQWVIRVAASVLVLDAGSKKSFLYEPSPITDKSSIAHGPLTLLRATAGCDLSRQNPFFKTFNTLKIYSLEMYAN